MPVRTTSIQAYHDEQPRIGARQRQVLEAFQKFGPMNNRRVSQVTGLEINAVTPRVHELRKVGLLREFGRGPDPVTGKTTIVFCAANTDSQMEMF